MAVAKPKKQETKKAEPAKKAPAKAAPKKEAAPKKAETTKKPVEKKAEVKEVKKQAAYEIFSDKASKQWGVRIKGSKHTIKLFKTQKEAITYADKMAKNNDKSVMVRSKEGHFRKK